MSGLLLCGRQSLVPYYIPEIDKNLYSYEELCYYLYHYIYLVNENFFNDQLLCYLEQQLHLGDLADNLKEMMKKDADYESLVLTVFRAGYYYEDEDLTDLVDSLRQMQFLSVPERLKLRADTFLSCQKYRLAIMEYRKILRRPDVKPDSELTADIWYSMGVIHAWLFLYRDAAECFRKAFEISSKETFLKSYVNMLILEDDTIGQIRLDNVPIAEEMVEECRNEIALLRQQVRISPEFIEAEQDSQLDQWRIDYRERVSG